MQEFIGILQPFSSPLLSPIYSNDIISVFCLSKLNLSFINSISNKSFFIDLDLLDWCLLNGNVTLASKLIKSGLTSNLLTLLPKVTNYQLYIDFIQFGFIDPRRNPHLLIHAVRSNSLTIVPYLLKYINSDLTDAITECCKSGNTVILTLLLKHNNKLKIQTSHLYTAVSHNHSNIVSILLCYNVNYIEKNYHCLTLASQLGHLGLFVWLLDYIETHSPPTNPSLELSISNSVNQACLHNHLPILTFIFTKQHNIILKNKLILKTFKVRNNNISLSSGTLNWLAKKQQSSVIQLLLDYNHISNTHFINMSKCNPSFMSSFLI